MKKIIAYLVDVLFLLIPIVVFIFLMRNWLEITEFISNVAFGKINESSLLGLFSNAMALTMALTGTIPVILGGTWLVHKLCKVLNSYVLSLLIPGHTKGSSK